MRTIDKTRLTDAIREAVLAALDDVAPRLFEGSPLCGRDAGASDSDLPALFAVLDSHALTLATRYGFQVDDGEEEPEPVMKWGAGWNMPGYMPDSEPTHFATWTEARDYMKGELERASDDEEDETAAGELLEWANEMHTASPDMPWGVTVGAYHYWISAL